MAKKDSLKTQSDNFKDQILQINTEKEIKDKDKGELQKYFLGLFFYKYLSKQLLNYINNELKDDGLTYHQAWHHVNFKKDIVETLLEYFGYIIEPKYLWDDIVELIKKDEYDNEYLANAKNSFNDSVIGQESQKTFENIFSTMELTSPLIGQTEKERSKFISLLFLKIDDLKIEDKDLGDAFEFAYNYYSILAGKDKAGDFYTAPSISSLIAKLATWDHKTINKVNRVRDLYDSSCGSSSLMLHVKKEVHNITNYYGQDNKINAVNFSKMNLIIHGISYKHIDIYCQDVLDYPNLEHLTMKYDVIVSDFQFSQGWSGKNRHSKDERFTGYPRFAPNGTADYAFIQHMLYLLKDSGKMVIHCPHGVLFREKAESEIRKYLIDKNYIETIIALPSKIVTKKSPSTCLLVLSKCKTNNNIMFINALNEYTEGKPINYLSEQNIDYIFSVYKKREIIDRFSNIVDISDISSDKNNYNLNLPRYLNFFDDEEEIVINEVLEEIDKLELEKNELDSIIQEYLKELGVGKYGKQ